jgi:hypothetical protein
VCKGGGDWGGGGCIQGCIQEGKLKREIFQVGVVVVVCVCVWGGGLHTGPMWRASSRGRSSRWGFRHVC